MSQEDGSGFSDFCNMATMVVFGLCLQHVCHAQITLTFYYPGETIEMYKESLCIQES